MNLIHLQPFREIESFNRRINRFFDDALGDISQSFAPAAEISETANALHLRLEIPGMEAEDLDIQVTKDFVSVSGERKEESKTSEGGVTRSEFRYGQFQRVIPLPTEIQNDQVTAEYKNGILNLTLPKTETMENKAVKVKVN